MLVLSRKPGDSIQIADNITLTVLSAKGDRIRLGIKAPENVRIMRSEIVERAALSFGDAQVATESEVISA